MVLSYFALHLPSLASAAQAGTVGLADVEGDKTWEWTGCFGSHLKPKGVVWKGDVQEWKWVALKEDCVVRVRGKENCLYPVWPEMSLHYFVTVSHQPQSSAGVPGPLQSVCGCC